MEFIVEVKPLPGFRIWIKFQNGLEGIVNLSDLTGKGVFAKWNESGFFDSVFVDTESHTVSWPGGIDLCPDSLYAEITGKTILESVHA